MSLSRVKVWGTEVLFASDLNAEFDNILNNAASLISPLGGALDWDGYAHTLDAAGVTTAQSTASIAWAFTPGNKTGTPSTTGGITNCAASTWTDNNTAGSGTATNWVGHAFQRPTLAASNSSVTTTNAATVYIANAPLAGSNETLTNTYALWVDDGVVRFDGNVHSGALAYTWPAAAGALPTIASQAEVTAMTSTTTALTPNHLQTILGTLTATTSGSTIDFTGIPAGVRQIWVMFRGVSISGTDNILVQLGDSGGFETSGYISTGASVAAAGVGVDNSTAGFIVRLSDATDTISGILTLSLMDAATFLWASGHNTKRSTTIVGFGGGEKALSAELTQVRITVTGANTFDAGSVNVSYGR